MVQYRRRSITIEPDDKVSGLKTAIIHLAINAEVDATVERKRLGSGGSRTNVVCGTSKESKWEQFSNKLSWFLKAYQMSFGDVKELESTEKTDTGYVILPSQPAEIRGSSGDLFTKIEKPKALMIRFNPALPGLATIISSKLRFVNSNQRRA